MNPLSDLNTALLRNVKQYLTDTAFLRNDVISNTRDQLLQIMLHHSHMQHVQHDISDSMIAKELTCSRALVTKYRNSKTPFKNIHAARKKKGLKPNCFLFKHNDLAQVYNNCLLCLLNDKTLCIYVQQSIFIIFQLIVKFWIEHSTPSPSLRDVKYKHSQKPGDHARVRDENGRSYTVVCKTKKCQMHQKRYFTFYDKLSLALRKCYLFLSTVLLFHPARRFAMGTDEKIFLKFLARYKTQHLNLSKLVKKWRFRSLKPFYISKPEQQ
jgi:hypothetical protein